MKNIKKLTIPLRFLVSAGLIFFLYRRIAFHEFIAVFQTLRFWPLLFFFMLLFFNTAIHALKWKLLLQADGILIPWSTLTASYLVGTFFNMFLPSNIGGDAYRVYDVARTSKRAAHSFASVLADRLSGYVALVVVATGCGLAGLRLLPNSEILWIPVIGMAGLLLIIGASFQQRLIRWFLDRSVLERAPGIRAFVLQLLDSVNQYRNAPDLFVRIMIVSFVFQFSVIICIYLLALGLDFDIPLHYFFVFVPFVSIMEALPISIFGLGIRDASYAYFFTHVGLPEVYALTLALAYVVVTLVYASSGGIIFLLRTPRRTRPSG